MNQNIGTICPPGTIWDPLSFRCRTIPPSCFNRDETRAASCPIGFTGTRTERYQADCPEGPYGAQRVLINWNVIQDSCVPKKVIKTTTDDIDDVVEVDANAVCSRVGANNLGSIVAYCGVANSHSRNIEEWGLPKNGGTAWAAQYVCQEYGFKYAIEMSYGAGNTSRNTAQAWYIYPNNRTAGNEQGYQNPIVAPYGVVPLARLWCSNNPNATRPKDCQPVNYPSVVTPIVTAVRGPSDDGNGNITPGTVCDGPIFQQDVTVSGGEGNGDSIIRADFCNVNSITPAYTSPGLFSGEAAYVESVNLICMCEGNTTTCYVPSPPTTDGGN